ncbi:hypothetical protein K2173_006819 [Erythroxylum novogranatense]|uniref:J domain-containing protein n=1 Tax=Erythroxylum novogranatense TaxID=1862640 RepID=A0AAV8SZF7_9ROSI|nr:hypothetical protein K2173_006819 [Erythroxylum novogranatense]
MPATSTACLPITSVVAKSFFRTPNLLSFYPSSTSRKPFDRSFSCKAASSSSSPITDFDLYDLLGIESSSSQSKIKTAYRTLQKRCHPDIAGPTGHDMAIILNEAYAVLSDPTSRLAYDKEQAKFEELRGYTGKPLYSLWFGSESERRAVFVDEVKCVGCLKCALFAEKTFAIESVYGRARVVAQWADPENKIQAAIETCPVDCISIVERSDLAALEFLMSKQPRGNVRVGASNSVGTRVSNIFVDAKKFQTRVTVAKNKASGQNSQETDLQREARISAIQAIRSISNWLYWQSPKVGPSTSESHQSLMQTTKNSSEPDINKLREAAAARKHARQNGRSISRSPLSYMYHDEYWIPSTQALPGSTLRSGSRVTSEVSQTKDQRGKNDRDYQPEEKVPMNPIMWRIPLLTATIAASVVYLQVGERAIDGLDEHIGGSLALQIVNSFWLHITLAWITWYLIGAAATGIVENIRNRS